jgi:hypothetical protein
MTLHSIINSDTFDKRNLVQLYNLFFTISINYSKNFHSYLEIYFEAILDIIKHKLHSLIRTESYINIERMDSNNQIIQSENNLSDLKNDYYLVIESIIKRTFTIINTTKLTKKNQSGSLLDYFFIGKTSKIECDFPFEEYRCSIYKYLKISQDFVKIKNFNEDLIEISKILEIIKNQEEEFIFFVSLAASKILDFNLKAEHYYSLIFLNEILDFTLKEKEFIKIWQNLFNIFLNKLEFKHLFDKEENLFDIFYINHFLYEILIRFFTVIDVEDYILLLEKYQEIENMEVLASMLEDNDRLICYLLEHKHYKLKNNSIDKVFESNMLLVNKIIEFASQQIVSTKNNFYLNRMKQAINWFCNLLRLIPDMTTISSDSFIYIHKNIFYLYDNNFIQVFNNYLNDSETIFNLVKSLIEKLVISLPKTDDEKWELYYFILQFCFNSILIENEGLQRKYMSLCLEMFEVCSLPLYKYKELTTLLTVFYNRFSLLKAKYEEFWPDIFKLFFLIFTNNNDLYTSTSEIETLWTLFIKKFIISFVDYKKKNPKLPETLYKPHLVNIFAHTIMKGKYFLICSKNYTRR